MSKRYEYFKINLQGNGSIRKELVFIRKGNESYKDTIHRLISEAVNKEADRRVSSWEVKQRFSGNYKE